MNTNTAHLDQILRTLATSESTMTRCISNASIISDDVSDIGTISEDEQKALDAFYAKYSAIVTDDASAIPVAVVKVHRKKKLSELFHDGVCIREPNKNDDAVDISATYTAHTLLPDGEYKIEQKSTSIHFRKYKTLKKRSSKEEYNAKDNTIHNYGMMYKPNCPCNFTRVAKFILEHPNHLFKNTLIPENLTILYYDKI